MTTFSIVDNAGSSTQKRQRSDEYPVERPKNEDGSQARHV